MVIKTKSSSFNYFCKGLAVGMGANKIAGILALDEIELSFRCIMVAELLLNNF
jgi:hypothetical protein